MHCKKCGKQLPDGVKFCMQCGSAVERNVEKAQKTKPTMSRQEYFKNHSTLECKEWMKSVKRWFIIYNIATTIGFLFTMFMLSQFIMGNTFGIKDFPQFNTLEKYFLSLGMVVSSGFALVNVFIEIVMYQTKRVGAAIGFLISTHFFGASACVLWPLCIVASIVILVYIVKMNKEYTNKAK